LDKGTKFELTNNDKEVFNGVKAIWIEKLELAMLNFLKRGILECDASDVSLDTRRKAKSIRLKSFKKAVRNYGITEKEMLACIRSIEKFEFFYLVKNLI
jgi:hypothetical protein